ncbi:MAG: MFS transporter, partial [Candidatus Deferrimicrobium sp.]
MSSSGSDRDAGVVLPLAITLAIQAMAAMASVTVPVLAPVASVDTGVALNYIGGFVAIFYFGGMVSGLASGDFILRYGPIRVSQCCLVFCGIGLAATAVGSLLLMILGALFIGIGYGPVTPASSHLLARTAPPHLMSLTFSTKQTGVPIGGAMAGALVPPLVLSLGWKWASIVVGGVCVLLAVLAETSRGTLDTDLQMDRRLSFTGIMDPLKLVCSLSSIRELAVMSFFF